MVSHELICWTLGRCSVSHHHSPGWAGGEHSLAGNFGAVYKGAISRSKVNETPAGKKGFARRLTHAVATIVRKAADERPPVRTGGRPQNVLDPVLLKNCRMCLNADLSPPCSLNYLQMATGLHLAAGLSAVHGQISLSGTRAHDRRSLISLDVTAVRSFRIMNSPHIVA